MGKLEMICKDKLSKIKVKEYLNFLNKYKCSVGFGDWKIMLNEKVSEMNGSLATVDSNYLDKTLNIDLSSDFMGKTKKEQRSILFHELLHGRIQAHSKKISDLSETEEECLVNDLVRGFEKYLR